MQICKMLLEESGAKGMRQRDLCREWSTQAEANTKEAKKAGLFWRYYSKL